MKNTIDMKRRQLLAATGAGAAVLAGFGGAPRAAVAATLPTWVSNLPLWHWHQVPGTALSSVQPSPKPLGITGPRSKIDAWCGATLKRAGSVYMLGAAGGHADYAGNEVDALQLNAETPAWKQLRGPTPDAQIIDGSQYYLDLRPSATHTYYSTQFIESLGRMVVFASPGLGGIGATPPANWAYTGSKRSFSFNTATGDWDSPDYIAHYPGTGDFTACLCVKHPWTDDVYYSRNSGGWYRWAKATNTWTKLSEATRAPWYAGTAIDPTRDRILVVGGYSPSNPEVHDLNGYGQAATFGGLGASALAVTGYPSVIYDEASDRFLVVYNSGASINVLRVHPQTWFVDQPAITGTAPAARVNGMQNAAQYAPELGGFVLANSYGGNVFFMRTALSGGTAPPTPVDTTPPNPPGGLSAY